MTLYFAYGSNLNLAQMARRCPAARNLGRFILTDARLVFRGVADCIFEEGAECHGGLWEITKACEYELDRYEGVSSGLYYKDYFRVTTPEGPRDVLVYRMNSTGIFPPSRDYYATIERGFRDFGLSLKTLRAALNNSWDDKSPSHVERQRHKRKGRPLLASPHVAVAAAPKGKGKKGKGRKVKPLPTLFDYEETTRAARAASQSARRGAKSLKEWMDERGYTYN